MLRILLPLRDFQCTLTYKSLCERNTGKETSLPFAHEIPNPFLKISKHIYFHSKQFGNALVDNYI